MCIHITSKGGFYSASVKSFEWQVLNAYRGPLASWAVPVFVMMSGALFLSRDIPIKKLYGKYIFRMFTAFVFWSFVYEAIRYVRHDHTMQEAVANFILGYAHMWFLYMISGLYMIVPFMKKIADSETLTKYFLTLALIFACILPETMTILTVFVGKGHNLLSTILWDFHMRFVMGFSGYFLLGYVLDSANISAKLERVIYVAGIIGAVVTLAMSVYTAVLNGSPSQTFHANTTVDLFIMCEAAAVFVFFKKHFNKESKLAGKLAQCSFGAYLVHYGIVSFAASLGINALTFSPIISVPAIACGVFIISFTVSAILNRSSLLRKYIG